MEGRKQAGWTSQHDSSLSHRLTLLTLAQHLEHALAWAQESAFPLGRRESTGVVRPLCVILQNGGIVTQFAFPTKSVKKGT